MTRGGIHPRASSRGREVRVMAPRRGRRRPLARRAGGGPHPRRGRHARCGARGRARGGASRARAAGALAVLRRGAGILPARGHLGPPAVAADEVAGFPGARAPVGGAVRARGCANAGIRGRGRRGEDREVERGRARRAGSINAVLRRYLRERRDAGRGHRAQPGASACLARNGSRSDCAPTGRAAGPSCSPPATPRRRCGCG